MGIDVGSINFAIVILEKSIIETTILYSNTVTVSSPTSINAITISRKLRQLLLPLIIEYKITHIAIEKQPWYLFRNSAAHITCANIVIESLLLVFVNEAKEIGFYFMSIASNTWHKYVKFKGKKTIAKYRGYTKEYHDNYCVDISVLKDVHQHDALFIALALYYQ